jgi:hypothetical protein
MLAARDEARFAAGVVGADEPRGVARSSRYWRTIRKAALLWRRYSGSSGLRNGDIIIVVQIEDFH